jgi:hypothetical protein
MGVALQSHLKVKEKGGSKGLHQNVEERYCLVIARSLASVDRVHGAFLLGSNDGTGAIGADNGSGDLH